MSRRGPVLRSISPEATPDEVAAIVAALAALPSAASSAPSAEGSSWVRVSRLSARRTGLMRGPWRLSGRIGRRARA
jgi:hypothetical protein